MLTGEYSEISREEIREKLEKHGTLDAIRDEAFRFAKAAGKNLDVLEKSEYRDALEGIANFVIDRKM